MEQFNAYRMISRIECATRMIMQRYELSLSTYRDDLKETIDTLAKQVADGTDRALLENMSVALDICNTEIQSQEYDSVQALVQEDIGEREVRYIFNNYPDSYAERILSPTDYDQERKELEQERKELEQNRNEDKRAIARILRITLFIILAMVACFWAWNYIYELPYFAERRAFAELEEEFEQGSLSTNSLSNYYKDFADGAHLEDVMIMEVEVNSNSYGFIKQTEAIQNYLRKFPDGRKAADFRKILDDIMVKCTARYKDAAGDSPTEAQAFMIDMLEYMHANQVTQVYVVAHPQIKLKDFNDYPEAMQDSLHYVIKTSTFFRGDLSISSIKDKIDESSVNDWISSIAMALSKSVVSTLKAELVDLKVVEAQQMPADSKNPLIHIYYTVTNQEFDDGSPALWLVKKELGPSRFKINSHVILGIRISFEAQFLLPGTDRRHTLSAMGDAGDAEIQNSDDPYKAMCDRCTADFCHQVINYFALRNK